MNLITIPKKMVKNDDLVVLPRKEYERLLARLVPEFSPTATDKRELARARKNKASGNYLTINELERKLGFTN
jgi:hypothetical protein